MKKNLIFGLFATAMLLLTTACQKENDLVNGNEVMVNFEVSAPVIATRAYSDGETAKNLQYAVYNSNKVQLATMKFGEQTGVGTAEMNNLKARVSMRLALGNTYYVLFWAEADNAPYDVNFADKTLTVNYDNAKSNDENRDAFYCWKEVTDEELRRGSVKIEMRRPFAQLNIGTGDTEIAKASGVEVETTAVKVKAYQTMDFVDGTVSNAVEEGVQFGFAAKPDGQTFPVANYDYLAMNYLLVGTDKEVVNEVVFEYTGAEATTPEKRVFTSIPLRRNYRTNIYGNLLTQAVDFNVEIKPEYLDAENVEAWDGKSVVEPKFENGTYTITTGEELAWLAGYVNGTLTRAGGDNTLEGVTVVLANNIDLGGNEWTPIGINDEIRFEGTFDGNGYTINNLNIVETEAKEGKAYIGFFGYAKDATIKNVTFTNVNLNIACLDIDHSQGHIGAVAGSLEGTSTIENVTVNGNIKVEATVTANGASRVAVVAGGNSYGDVTMKNVHVRANNGSYLKANNNVGALAGQLQGKSVFEDCSSNIPVTGTKFFAGGIIGLAAGDQTFTNCHTTGNVTITAGREGRAHDHYRVGGIAGGWADGAKNVCTLTGCTYTGALSGTNADDSVAEAFDYAGYVGRGYTLNGCQGSKVIIDGVEYVQAFNEAANAGIYYVNGELVLSTAAALRTFAQKVNTGVDYFGGKTIKLGADIDLNNEEWTPIGSAVKDHGFMGNFDGNGKTIKNLKISNITPDADGYVYAGLFGVTEGVDKNNQNYIKNLTIENVNIDLDGDIVAAAIAYPYYTALENILVKGKVSIKGGDYTSGVLAYTRRLVNAKNIAIAANQGSAIEGNITVGGVISDIQTNGGLVANYSNFEATGLTIKGTKCVGGISGIISNQTLNGATVKNVAIDSEDRRKGAISGAFDGESVINNAIVENVTGADDFVGALYEGTMSETTSVTINGLKYTYNNGLLIDGYEVLADGLLKKGSEYKVINANGLVALSAMTIKGGEVVTLGADIDLKGVEFNGLRAFNPENNNTFDGKDFTVSNWTNNLGASDMGFIKEWVGPIKNVKFDNCHLKTSGRSAIVAAKVYSNIENVEVKGSSIEDSHWACGIVAGLYNNGSVSNVTVTNSSVKSNGGTGGIVGVMNESAGTRGFYNCSISNSTVNNTGAYGEGYSAALICGMLNIENATIVFDRCSYDDHNTKEGQFVGDLYYKDGGNNIVEK